MMDAHVPTVMCNDFILLAIINIHVWFVYIVYCILYSICCSIVLKWIHDALVYIVYTYTTYTYIYVVTSMYSVGTLYCIYIDIII